MGWKNTIWKAVSRHLPVTKPSVQYCVDKKLFPLTFVSMPSAVLREQLMLPAHEQTTQLNQDLFGLLMNRFRSGYFVEIGANDGKTFSNTIYLEDNFKWRGLLVEPNPRYTDSLAKRSNAVVCAAAVADIEGEAAFADAGLYGGMTDQLDSTHERETGHAATITVPCKTVMSIFDEYDVPNVIDFLSLDIEGGEIMILRQLVRNFRRIRCGCIELNHRSNEFEEATHLLESAGYEIVWKNQTKFDWFFIDPKLVKST